ncbi:MAG: hypothetical protein GXP45_03965, partial [bacterium]|nr:hypothetical protein [bacterium]
MKTNTFLFFVACLFVTNTLWVKASFAQTKTEELHLGGSMQVHTYPNSDGDDILVQGEGKYFSFPLANYSGTSITRAVKLFIISSSNQINVVWEEVISVPAWDFITIEIADCDNPVQSSPGNYTLELRCEHSSALSSVNINSILLPVVDGGSGAENPQNIQILTAGSFDSGCNTTEYYLNFVDPNSTSVWHPGDTKTIRWNTNTSNVITTVTLWLYRESSANRLISSSVPNTGSYSYQVPDDLPVNYNYHLRLYNNDGPYLNVVSENFWIENLGSPPNTPSNLQASVQSDHSILLSWDNVTDETGYVLDFCDGNVIVNLPTNQTSYLVDNLNPSTGYSFKIKSVNNYGSSNYSSCVNTTTSAPAQASLEVSSVSILDTIQKGKACDMIVTVVNTGNATFDGDVFLSWHNENMEYLTDLASFTGTLTIGESKVLFFHTDAIVSDRGSYFAVTKYRSTGSDTWKNIAYHTVNIVGMDVLGDDLSDSAGNTSLSYHFNDLVNPETIENVPLRSFLVIENLDNNEINIEEMSLGQKSASFSFFEDRSFKEGNYKVTYVAFYDWDQKKSGQKTAVKILSDLPWYSFWGLSSYFQIVDPYLDLIDVTNYSGQTEPIANYNLFGFVLKIPNDTGNESVKIRFYNTSTGQVIENTMTYFSDPDVWILDKAFDFACVYDYRFIVHTGIWEFDYPQSGDNPLSIEVHPYFDSMPMKHSGIVHETSFMFYNYIYDDISDQIQVYLHLYNPDDSQTVIEMNNDNDRYFYNNHIFDAVGSYYYYIEAIAPNGKTFTSPLDHLFINFGNNCDYIQKPPMISRKLWCPGCNDDNPENGYPTHIILHDTETENGDNSYGAVRELRNNALSEGYSDIPYHYLIASDGRIFEGLEGGVMKRGNHFSCMNGRTIGIAFLGDFDVEEPSDKTLESLDLLLEYLCSQYHIDPQGVKDHIYYDFTKKQWENNVALPQISLHRIVGNYPNQACSIVDCPGIFFPALEENITPFVHYCDQENNQLALELSSPISIEINKKSTSSQGLHISSQISSLYDPVTANLRFLLLENEDSTLLFQKNDVDIDTLKEIEFDEEINSGKAKYGILLQYQVNDTTSWHKINSELFQNPVSFDLSALSVVEQNNNYQLFPNPNQGEFNLNFSSESPRNLL